MRKLLIPFGLLFAAVVVGCGGAEVVATVNDENITQEQLDSRVAVLEEQQEGEMDEEARAQAQERLLDELINERLLMQRAEEEGIDESSEQVQAQLEQIRSQFGDEESFQEALDQQGLTEDELTNAVVQQTVFTTILEDQIEEPTESDLREMYDTIQDQGQDLPDFEEVRPALEQQYMQQQQQQAGQQLLDDLREEADIEKML